MPALCKQVAYAHRKVSAWAIAHCSKLRGCLPVISRTVGSTFGSSSSGWCADDRLLEALRWR